MNRKLRVLILSLLIVMAGVVTYLGIVKPTPTINTDTIKQETVETTDVKIALVNEDTGTNYNNQAVNVGKTLVNSFDSKTDYPIEIVSRAIAERGLENGSYQLMVILPSKFSSEALALESREPTQTAFQYQIKSDKQIVIRKAEQAVSDLKSQFNKDLINIYFSSIIGNLQSAQNYVSDVVANEGNSLTAYQNNLLNPLSDYSQLFSGIKSSPDSILSTYSSFKDSLNNTNDSFTSIMNVDKTYDTELSTIQDLQTKWQTSIEQREKNLATYDEEFSKLSVTEEIQQLQGVQTVFNDGLKNPVSWEDTVAKTQSLNTDIDSIANLLTEFNTTVEESFLSHEQKISKAVEESLNSVDGILGDSGTTEQTLGLFIKNLNNNMIAKVDNKLGTVKLLDNAAIDALSLSDLDKRYLKNINSFVTWYAGEYGKTVPSTTPSNQVARTEAIRNHVVEGLSAGGTLTIPELAGEVTEVTITVPSNYTISVDGYSVTQISANDYMVAIAGAHPRLSLQYHLNVIDATQLNVLSPAVVTAYVNTSEKVDVAVAKDKTEEVPVTPSEPSTPSQPVTPSEPSTPSESSSSSESVSTPETETSDTTTGTTNTAPSSEPKTETKVTTVYEPERKEFKRTYSVSSTLFPYQTYTGHSESEMLFEDIDSYLELAGIVNTIFDINLSDTAGNFKPGANALINSADTDTLKTIIVNLLKDSTISSLKSSLQVPQKEIDDLNNKKIQAAELESTINELKLNTETLVDQLVKVLAETEKVNATISSKPELVSNEVTDNTNMVTVTTDMNADLVALMGASRSLMENTKSNQTVSESINQTLTQLQIDVVNLETQGTSLSGRVEQLNTIMSTDYKDNESFLQAFSGVLSNAKNGNEKNQAVYEYLSNPVDAKNVSVVLGVSSQAGRTTSVRDERSSFLIILISFIISLGLTYALQNTKWLPSRKTGERVSWSNTILPMSVLSGAATVAALIIFTITGIKLDLVGSQLITLIFMGIILLLAFSYGNNLLLKRFKHVGFLVSIGLLLLYIISASQLFDVQYATTNQGLALISPLTYTEEMLQFIINRQDGWGVTLGILLVLTPILGVMNAFLYKEVED